VTSSPHGILREVPASLRRLAIASSFSLAMVEVFLSTGFQGGPRPTSITRYA